MASGLLGFLGFGKRAKPSLTQNFQKVPSATESPLWPTLSDLAQKYTRGEGVGFGPDYLSRTTNPAIAQIDANFQNRTLPFLSSELSKRGIARSAGGGLATDVLGQADLQRNRDINSLMANFYDLNEKQKKHDIEYGSGLGRELQGQFLNQGAEAARQFNQAEAGNTQRTVARSEIDNQMARQNQQRTIAALVGSAIGGQSPGSAMPTISHGGFPIQTSTYGPNNVPVGFEGRLNPGSANILRSHSYDSVSGLSQQQLTALLAQVFGG